MKKVFSFMALALLSLLTVASLVACGGSKEEKRSAAEIINLLLVNQDEYVDHDFYVGNEIKYDKEKDALPITWTSSDEDVLKVGSEVVDIPPHKAGEPSPGKGYKVSIKRPETGVAEVKLTASITLDKETATKDFNYRLFAYEVSDYLENIDFEKNNKLVSESFEIPTSVTLDGRKSDITWKVSEASKEWIDIKTIEGSENLKVEILKVIKEETPVSVEATMTYQEQTATKTFKFTLVSAFSAPEQVAPVAGQKVIYGMYQENLVKMAYFTGDMAGYYMATTEDPTEAATITVEAREGGFDLTFMKGSTKNYIYVEDGGAHINAKFGKEQPATPWTWDAEKGMLVMKSGEKLLTNGTKASGTYDTIGGMDASKELFVAGLYEIPFVAIDHLEGNEGFILGMNHTGLMKTFYFTGEMDGYYFATTTDPKAAVEIKLEKLENGYNLFFVDKDGATQYIGISISGSHINAVFGTDKPVNPWTWNQEAKRFEMTINEKQYFLGTSAEKTYETIGGASEEKGPQIACGLYAKAGHVATVKPFIALEHVAPEAGKEYYLTMGQGNSKKQLYFTGAMNKFYYATTTEVSKAVKITVEAVEGGFQLSFLDKDGNKQYLDITDDGAHINPVFAATEAAGPWTWNQEAKRLERLVGEKVCVLGNWGTYNNISATNKLDNVFLAGLVEAK